MFDPPHIGHVILAREAAWQLGLDEVRLVVCARPPHRGEGWLPAETRVRLVERAVAGVPGLTVSRVELDRPGPSYTVDTLEGFAAAEPGAGLWLLIGEDQLAGFAGWRDPERICALARLGVVSREGADSAAAEEAAAGVAPGRVDWVRMPTIGVSSSAIRGRIAAGQPVGHLLPDGVGDVLVTEGFAHPAGRDSLRGPSRPI